MPADEANLDPKTVSGFGREWKAFDFSGRDGAETQASFSEYFSLFPWPALPKDARGFDLGCGSGRWARLVAPRVGELICIDASADAAKVAERNLASFSNCPVIQASVSDMPIADASMDFGYSLGVLHHVPDTQAGIAACVRKLKPSAPFLLYLYYALENRSPAYRALWSASDAARKVIADWPFPLRYAASQLIAAVAYWPTARAARLLERLGFSVCEMPLSYYRQRSFYVMRNDALDRFGTALEQRFTRKQIEEMMQASGLERIAFREAPPYWCALGYKGG